MVSYGISICHGPEVERNRNPNESPPGIARLVRAKRATGRGVVMKASTQVALLPEVMKLASAPVRVRVGGVTAEVRHEEHSERMRATLGERVTQQAQRKARADGGYGDLVGEGSRGPERGALRVGATNNAAEAEADRVADAVMRGEGARGMESSLGGVGVQRKCAACEDEDERTVRREASSSEEPGSEAPPIVAEVLEASGRALDASTRAVMEPRLGHDFSDIRVHDDPRAADSARSIGARAYTFENHLVFDNGQYRPDNHDGQRLIAHELVHAVQQSRSNVSGLSSATVQRQTHGTQGAPPALPVVCDTSAANPMLWFVFDSTDLRHDAEVDSTVHLSRLIARVHQHFEDVGQEARLELRGFASEEGTSVHNLDLSRRRAERVRALLEAAGLPGGRIAVAGLGEVSDLPTRELNRRVEICLTPTVQRIEMEEERITGQAVDCTHPPGSVTNLTQYAMLVGCIERALPSLGARDMLSLLRQAYYGGGHWPEVIRCGTAAGRRGLGTLRTSQRALHDALIGSKVVSGVDLGHVFTGLEAMVCPTPEVEIEVFGPNPVVAMPNEEFASWGGDLGSAAAVRTHDEVDRGLRRAWSHYFGSPGSMASHEDLRGDIDGYVLRAGLAGACAGSRYTPLPPLTARISQILLAYYGGGPGTNVNDRFRCFVQALGGTISAGRIVNKHALARAMVPSVNSFARTFYLSLVTVPLFAIGPLEAINLLRYSMEVSDLFMDWLESQL